MEGTKLKCGVAKSFKNPMECITICAGFDCTFVARLTHNSNQYAKTNILVNNTNCMWHGSKWEHITIQEMYHFLGIILKISLLPVDSGGYTSYFRDDNQSIIFDFTQDPEVIPNSNGFASKYMSLKQFKQI